MVTLDQIRQIAPCAPDDIGLDELNQAIAEFCIDTPRRRAAFLAQLAYESDQFRAFRERWGPTADQIRYERPVVASEPEPLATVAPVPLWQRLGNTQPGDGRRFLGRGAIQLTGRANYARCGLALGVDLVGHPGLAETPALRYRVSGWYWATHLLNGPADAGDTRTITRAINGAGMYGLEQREANYQRALVALSVGP